MDESDGGSYTYSINMYYQVYGCHYTWRVYVIDAVRRQAPEGSDLDLIILPCYPRSAILSMTVQVVDPHLSPPYN
jgi:hypothetical protein